MPIKIELWQCRYCDYKSSDFNIDIVTGKMCLKSKEKFAF